MKNAKKWRRNLQTIEFPNNEKYSDNTILRLIYEDVPERQALLKWIAFKISEENPVLFNMRPEDITDFLCDRGLLSSDQAHDFVQAQCSQKVNEDCWKVLFSFTRMHKFLKPAVEDRIGIRNKFAELVKGNSETQFSEHGPSVTIEEIDSDNDMEIQMEEEIRSIRTEMDKCSSQYSNQAAEKELKKKETTPLFEVGRSIEEIKFLNERYDNLSESHTSNNELVKFRKLKEPKKAWFQESDVIPRIYVMPGSPPLGQLDPSQLKIKIENSATPITIDGTPCSDNSQWQYRIITVEKHVSVMKQ